MRAALKDLKVHAYLDVYVPFINLLGFLKGCLVNGSFIVPSSTDANQAGTQSLHHQRLRPAPEVGIARLRSFQSTRRIPRDSIFHVDFHEIH